MTLYITMQINFLFCPWYPLFDARPNWLDWSNFFKIRMIYHLLKISTWELLLDCLFVVFICIAQNSLSCDDFGVDQEYSQIYLRCDNLIIQPKIISFGQICRHGRGNVSKRGYVISLSLSRRYLKSDKILYWEIAAEWRSG
jgi:hypothetical protein